MSTVLVTGATGFIAGHVIRQLLEDGHKVIGTIRALNKAVKLMDAFPEANASNQLLLETLSDITHEGELKRIFEKHPDISVVMHTASPCTFTVNDPVKDMLEPAINGTKSVLETTQKHAPNVTKIVITSSIAAMVDGSRSNDPSFVVTEQSWNPVTWEEAAKPNYMVPYVASKTFAEKAAWDFVKTQNPRFGITTVNPSAVFGPSVGKIDPKTLNASNEYIERLALDTTPGQEPANDEGFMWVDVRDVARAHCLAMDSKLNGERLLLCNTKYCAQDLLDIINANFPAIKGNIATGEPGTGKQHTDKIFNFDNSKTRELVDLKWIGLEESIIDFTRQFEEVLHEKKKKHWFSF